MFNLHLMKHQTPVPKKNYVIDLPNTVYTISIPRFMQKKQISGNSKNTIQFATSILENHSI
jgi:hypothetical protein